MASYAELFDIGEDFAAFVGHGLATEQGAVAWFRQKLESNGLPSALTERLQRIERRYRLLVAGEMWCPDCQINLAALDFAQRLQPNIELAIISKGRAEDDLRQRLALERIPIPLVLVLDEEFNLLGRFVERPQAVLDGGPQAVLDGGPQALAAYKAGDYLEHAIGDVLAIIEGAAR
ncbi:TPA: thioredoxin family protein [Pseudomonas aeruginosa]|nr:thioredoxin family protein [Pseudomonas aeruginosa]